MTRRGRSSRVRRAAALLAVAAGAWVALQWPVHTTQGINFHVTASRLPLYMKLLRFVARDAEYRLLAADVTRGSRDEEEKLLRLLRWVRTHIQARIPEGMPIVDDHVWHIIIRGYGAPDQLADVLATLCVYAGLPADLLMLRPPGRTQPAYALTMVRLRSPAFARSHGLQPGEARERVPRAPDRGAPRWYLVDPYYGVVVRDAEGWMVPMEELLAHRELIRQTAPGSTRDGLEYADVYGWISEKPVRRELRPYRHMPLARAWFAMARGLRALWGAGQ